jgi:RNase P subunit RPR2
MNIKISKSAASKKIDEFFKHIKDKDSREIKKIKRLAMAKKVPLKDKRKLFCKKCLNPYKNPKVRVKNKVKSVVCENCKSVSRWKL